MPEYYIQKSLLLIDPFIKDFREFFRNTPDLQFVSEKKVIFGCVESIKNPAISVIPINFD